MNKVNLLLVFLILAVCAVGQSKVLTILVNFQDRQEQPFTKEYARSVTDAVTAYYAEQSFGRQSFTFDITDWQTLPMIFVCDENQIASLAQLSVGYDLSQYQHKIYVFPGAECGWTGSAEYLGSQIWINTYFDLSSVAHELGHNLGLYHSSFQYPNGAILDTGDRFDVMGASQSAHFNLYQKEKLGWVVVPEVLTGNYILAPYETSGGIKVRSVSGVYYIERRTTYGFDSVLALGVNNSLAGFLVHYKGSYRSPVLLDMTPETSSIYDAALEPGRTYSDGTISITAVSDSEVSVATPAPTPAPCKKFNPKGKCIK